MVMMYPQRLRKKILSFCFRLCGSGILLDLFHFRLCSFCRGCFFSLGSLLHGSLCSFLSLLHRCFLSLFSLLHGRGLLFLCSFGLGCCSYSIITGSFSSRTTCLRFFGTAIT